MSILLSFFALYAFLIATKYCSHNLTFYEVPSEFIQEQYRNGEEGETEPRQFIEYNRFCAAPDQFEVGNIVAYKKPGSVKREIGRIEAITEGGYRVQITSGVVNIEHDWIFARD